jgi:ABC-type multidrug transport system ATPase subunit
MNLPFVKSDKRHASSTGELLLSRGLKKQFPQSAGSLSRTLADHLRRMQLQRPKLTVFEEVDFTLFSGECVALLGTNGCGKSTFLRCLAGVISPTEGEVVHIGKTVSLLSHGYGAYEDLAVWRNIVLTQQLFGIPLKTAQKNIHSVASLAGLSDRTFGHTSQLSEGMRAKISLASLAHADFDVALLDESLNHVDSEFRYQFVQLTRKWIGEGRSILITSHDENLPDRIATRKLRFENKRLVEMR